MPYIKTRDWIDERIGLFVREFAHDSHITSGEVNYTITRILVAWLGDCPSYDDYNSALGVLEAVKLELYRRRVAPYEDKKKEENGDVF